MRARSDRNFSFNAGIREDLYDGITFDTGIEPRAGIAYNLKKTRTVLRISYARTFRSEFLFQRGDSGGPLRRDHVRYGNRAARGDRLQPEEDADGAENFLCAHVRDAVQ